MKGYLCLTDCAVVLYSLVQKSRGKAVLVVSIHLEQSKNAVSQDVATEQMFFCSTLMHNTFLTHFNNLQCTDSRHTVPHLIPKHPATPKFPLLSVTLSLAVMLL